MDNRIKKLLAFFFLFLFFNKLEASKYRLDDRQLELLSISYNVGKNIQAKDGMSFEKALSSIVLTETSSGKYVIGDTLDKLKKKRHLLKNSLGPFQIRISTIRVMSCKIKSLNYLKEKSDWWIMNKLLSDYTFGAVIAGNYLKLNYERTNFNYFRSISRYNGGNNNWNYYNKVMSNMNIINGLKEEGFFSDI